MVFMSLNSNMTGATSGTGTAAISEYLSLQLIFTGDNEGEKGGGRLVQSLVFCVVLCRPMFCLFVFFPWRLYSLPFESHLLNTPLISSKISVPIYFPYILSI